MLSNIQADWQTASVQGKGNYKSNTPLPEFFVLAGGRGISIHTHKSSEASLTDKLKIFQMFF